MDFYGDNVKVSLPGNTVAATTFSIGAGSKISGLEIVGTLSRKISLASADDPKCDITGIKVSGTWTGGGITNIEFDKLSVFNFSADIAVRIELDQTTMV